MAAVTIQSDRGISLQSQLAAGRGGVQNGSFNKSVALGNTLGSAAGELFIDTDGVSRLRFPPSTSFDVVGRLFTLTAVSGVLTQTAAAAFNHTFTTNAAGVTTIVANTAAVGFTVGKTNVPNNQGGTEDVINITLTAAGANVRGYLDVKIDAQSQVAPAAFTRQQAPAATVQAGRY